VLKYQSGLLDVGGTSAHTPIADILVDINLTRSGSLSTDPAGFTCC
jgi:hypothetical protein